MEQESIRCKKQPTARRTDTPLHTAARAGNLAEVKRILSLDGGGGGSDVENVDVWRRNLIAAQNEFGETALYVAAESGHMDILAELLNYTDEEVAEVKTRLGCHALHTAAKHGYLDAVRALLALWPGLATTADCTNCTPLYSAATQGHVEVVAELLAVNERLLKVAKSNGKTALHSVVRRGHLEVLRVLLAKDREICGRRDNKQQTALHMAVKGSNVEVVRELLRIGPEVLNLQDRKGNTALHVATRKGRLGIVRELLTYKDINLNALNKSKETALDEAEKSHLEAASEIKDALKVAGAKSGKHIAQPTGGKELKQTVSDIKHDVESQLFQTEQTQRRVTGIAKDLHKLHREGISNTVNSVTVVAVLIATIAFSAIYTIPGGYVQSLDLEPSASEQTGQVNVVKKLAFQVFFVFDSVGLFISLAVVVVQISLVASESKAQRKVIFIINKCMWMACVCTSVAFVALSFIVVGRHDLWIAIIITIIGGSIILVTLATLCYFVVKHRIRRTRSRSLRKTRRSSRSMSRSFSVASEYSDSDICAHDEKIYAI
ncbi:hypothetical protein SUGI_0029180 [Cryptomeria japonica]|uniref:ankyrin repeat-containing protein At2g01680 n=1 Tax=Cryptomeria japonica TaxID=3369 RepID=UPI002408D0D4|nr:ankyrin repeat-containing protein At2g01680 [Cryptomeria japonica]GLJ05961.1 hypothetical protein SUGI_0029180 [Cryptomeria japonica]